MGTSLSIISGKGGVGKTFLSINLSLAMAQFGRKILLVDGNVEQPNVGLGLNVDFVENSIHDYLAGKKTHEDIISSYHSIDVIYGDVDPKALHGVDTQRFRELLKSLRDRYDVIVVDTPPGFCDTLLAPFYEVENSIVVVTPNILSVVDAMRAKVISNRLKSRILGIVVNNITREKYITNESIEFAMNSKVLVEIPYDERIIDTMATGEPLLIKYPKSRASVKIMELAALLLGEEYGGEKK